MRKFDVVVISCPWLRNEELGFHILQRGLLTDLHLPVLAVIDVLWRTELPGVLQRDLIDEPQLEPLLI